MSGPVDPRDVLEREVRGLWPHVWQMACRVDQIPCDGDWMRYRIAGRSIVVVRAGAGIRAFHNVCPHQGVPFAQDAHGNCRNVGFICPYHGWRWTASGDTVYASGSNPLTGEPLDPADTALEPVRTVQAMGVVFVALSTMPAPFPPVERFVTIETMAPAAYRGAVIPVEWKAALAALLDRGDGASVLFPNLVVALADGGATMTRVRPTALQRSLVERWTLTGSTPADMMLEADMVAADHPDFVTMTQPARPPGHDTAAFLAAAAAAALTTSARAP